MSKQTKIIAIVGGVLILALLAYTGLSGGGFGAAFESVGCGGKKDPAKPRMSLESRQVNECLHKGFACQRDENGKAKMAKGAKACDKMPATFCKTLWGNKCKDAKFKANNKSGCAKFMKAATKEGDGDDD